MELQKPVNHQVESDSTIRFQEPVKDAAYYSLSLGLKVENGSISQGMHTNIPHKSIEIPLEELYDLSFYTTISAEDDRYSGAGLLAYANPEGTFTWSVSAYDEEGKKITQSNGYRRVSDYILAQHVLALIKQNREEEIREVITSMQKLDELERLAERELNQEQQELLKRFIEGN